MAQTMPYARPMPYSDPMPCSKAMPPRDIFHNNPPLAMAYVPWQVWNETYELDKALHVGTLFPCLDKPFMGRCACK